MLVVTIRRSQRKIVHKDKSKMYSCPEKGPRSVLQRTRARQVIDLRRLRRSGCGHESGKCATAVRTRTRDLHDARGDTLLTATQRGDREYTASVTQQSL